MHMFSSFPFLERQLVSSLRESPERDMDGCRQKFQNRGGGVEVD
jgi:hypothetical protein